MILLATKKTLGEEIFFVFSLCAPCACYHIKKIMIMFIFCPFFSRTIREIFFIIFFSYQLKYIPLVTVAAELVSVETLPSTGQLFTVFILTFFLLCFDF